MVQEKIDFIKNTLAAMYPDARCELVHHNPFELLIAVVLSAQTTDERVNIVTPKLFKRFPDPSALSLADVHEVEEIIASIGLYHSKASNIVKLAKELCRDYNGQVPLKREELIKLSGVGRKSANVVLSVAFDIPAMAVDTHVTRVAKRLGLAKMNDDVLQIERKLCRKFKRQDWSAMHHRFIFFGRYFCKAKNPSCQNCPFSSICKKDKVG